jgi:glycosyltransferase involved in cell wall biosynthesis
MTGRPAAIVYLVPGYPAGPSDSSCLPPIRNLIAEIASRQREREVHVVAFQYPFGAATYDLDGVKVGALGGGNRRGLYRAMVWLRALLYVHRLARRTRIELVHSFWLTECAWVGERLSKLLRVRHVATIAGQDARPDNPYLKRLAMRRLTVTAGSEFAAHHFFSSTGRHVDHVIPIGLDDVAPVPAGPRDIDVLGVGSLVPVKEYTRFVELLARIPPVRACLAGEGPESDLISRRIEEAGLADNLRLLGALSRPDVLALMKRSRILLHTARYEGQGYVFLEALRCGMHVVCYHVGFTPPGNRVHRCRSEEEMLEVLVRLLSRALDHESQEVPSIGATAAAYEEIYRSLSSKPASTKTFF